VFGVATISNDNLQDLKTGQLVGSTPWKQQVALVIGVIFGSLVIAPILDLLYGAFGFQGAPGADADSLAAPQAALISSLAQGVFGDSLDWNLIGFGALIGVAIIAVDEILGKRSDRMRLPPLAVGMGMYLPASLTLMIPLGAFAGRAYDNWAKRSAKDVERKQRLGILMATGLIVGESLYGVMFAGVVAATGKDEPLGIVGDGFLVPSRWLGTLLFVALIAWLYRRVMRNANASVDSGG
jgi:putative OPT family oligopeptide transporter